MKLHDPKPMWSQPMWSHPMPITGKKLWHKTGDGEYPAYGREVIALQRICGDGVKVVFAHRPDSAYIETYDGWNLPDIIYWLDVELPKEIEI